MVPTLNWQPVSPKKKHGLGLGTFLATTAAAPEDALFQLITSKKAVGHLGVWMENSQTVKQKSSKRIHLEFLGDEKPSGKLDV